MTGTEPTLPPERVEELAGALEVEVSEHARFRGAYDATCGSCARGRREATDFAQALAPLIAGWLAEAYSRGVNDTFDTDGALMKAREQGAAEVRVRVEAAIRLVLPDHITPMGARQILAALATEPEDQR